MKKKNIIGLLSMAFVSILSALSCGKEEISRPDPGTTEAGNKISISVSGDFNDFDGPEAKSSVESIFRMKWNDGDVVYVYGLASGSYDYEMSLLGSLTAKVAGGSDGRVADLSGTISEPEEDAYLTLVHCPGLTGGPSVTNLDYNKSSISIDLASQSGSAGSVTFVAYAEVFYLGSPEVSYRTSFKFATNVLRVNMSGMNSNANLTSAAIEGVETVCKLNFEYGEFDRITGESSGTISRTFSEGGTNARGTAAFYVALPVNSANADRRLTVSDASPNTYCCKSFAPGSTTGGGNMLNTIVPSFPKYADTYVGTYAPSTGVIWAPVNCGYDATSLPYGKLYQFARKAGSGYDSEEGIQTYVLLRNPDNHIVNHPADSAFYVRTAEQFNDWYRTSDPHMDEWPMTDPAGTTGIGNPCPDGWRVPTRTELSNLESSEYSWTTTGGPAGNQSGIVFGGSSFSLFFPAAGGRYWADEEEGSFRGVYGNYWSSSAGYGLYLDAEFKVLHADYDSSEYKRIRGNSVRCVHD